MKGVSPDGFWDLGSGANQAIHATMTSTFCGNSNAAAALGSGLGDTANGATKGGIHQAPPRSLRKRQDRKRGVRAHRGACAPIGHAPRRRRRPCTGVQPDSPASCKSNSSGLLGQRKHSHYTGQPFATVATSPRLEAHRTSISMSVVAQPCLLQRLLFAASSCGDQAGMRAVSQI